MSADPLQRVDLGQEATRHVEFSYSVKWLATDVPFAERMHRYAQYSFLPQSFEIHWLSIINSFVLVLLLTGAPPGTRLGPRAHTHTAEAACGSCQLLFAMYPKLIEPNVNSWREIAMVLPDPSCKHFSLMCLCTGLFNSEYGWFGQHGRHLEP